jgi:hypothetical protein
MRMELYRFNRTGAILAFFIGLFITWCFFVVLITTYRHNFSFLTIFGIFFTISASITIYAAATYLRLRQKGSKDTPPLVIIDDAGIWSWRDGRMPWSEIQDIEWTVHGRDNSDIIIVWRDQHYSFNSWGPLMDSNAKDLRIYPQFYNELRACWERNRRPSGAPSDSDQVLPSRS